MVRDRRTSVGAQRLDLQRRVQRHQEETLRERDRLGECLSQLGESSSTLKDSVLRLVGNMEAMLHARGDDEVRKGTFASAWLERDRRLFRS